MNKKDQLVLMAKQGLPKPQGSDARMLYYYTSENSNGYDSNFVKMIKERAPHWLQSKKQQETKKVKAQLLKLAYQGKEKLNDKILQNALWRYARPISKNYDPHFVHELQLIAPQWLLIKPKNPDLQLQIKQELLKLAKMKAPRPSKSKSKCGKWIWSLTSPKSNYYDKNFTQELKTLAPLWFVFPELEDKIKNKIKKQQDILALAKENKPKPQRGTKQGRALRAYCDPKASAYDPEFLNKIKTLAPHWMPKNAETFRDETKKQLLELAAANRKKPTYRESGLAKRLSDFTSKYSRFYDPKFTQTIKNLRPEWFLHPATQKKETLLNLAAQNLPKPKDRLRSAFYSYTQKSSKVYDPAFTREIKLKAPHWFRN